jgi:hypothetical protein
MNDERLDDLIDQHLNGTMSEEARRELEERLLHSAADRERFWQLAETHALVHEGIQQQLAEPAAHVVHAERPVLRGWRPRSVWFQWRPLTAAAAGVVFGMLCTSMVFAYAAPRFAGAKAAVWRLVSESFESGMVETLPGLPRQTGVWSGDTARVVTAEQDLNPKDGVKMLRFVSATFAGENAKQSAWGDVYRLVDLHGRVGEGTSVLRLSASFDGVRFPAGDEYACFVELCALEEDPADAPQPLTLSWVRENSASVAARKIPMVGDGAWQVAVVDVPVSPQTRFVLAHLAVQRQKPFPPSEPVQFGAHYLDDVKIELLSKPHSP